MNSQFEYQESLNALRFTDAQKEAIARRAAQAAQRQARTTHRPHRRPVRRMALIAALPCWCWRWVPPGPPASCGPR